MLDELRERLTFRDKPADEYLTIERHIDDDLFILADGTHGATIRFDGKPLGLLSEEGRYAERRRRHATFRALAGLGVVIYEHLVCHDRVEPFPTGYFRSAYAEALSRDYHAAVAPSLLAREWFVTILVRPGRVNGLLRRALGRTAEGDEALVQEVEERCATLMRALADHGPRRLGIRRERGIMWSATLRVNGFVLQQASGWLQVMDRAMAWLFALLCLVALGIMFVMWFVSRIFMAIVICMGPFLIPLYLFRATRGFVEG